MVLMTDEILRPLSMDEYLLNVFLLRDVYMDQADPDKELLRLTELNFIPSLHEKC